MTDKVVLITGATDGIGRQAARELAAKNMRIVIIGRNEEKLRAAVAELGTNGDGIQADLSIQAEVRRAAAEFRARYGRLDVLVNNAGNGFFLRQLSADGIEMTWALNHMAYFILTLELLEMLKASAPARIVNTSSSAHYAGRIHWNDVELKGGYWIMTAYRQSKLANVMFTLALARRLEGSGVTANALHPGFVRTNIGGTGNGPLGRLVQRIAFRRGISLEEGARTTVRLAFDRELEGVSGRFFTRFGERRALEAAYDVAAQERLWELSERYVIGKR
ncbi:MAG: SDR family oxidoreductase [Chloroflexi bacterium]|nr:SDR family oxidoreductase [Chloroflexota bacterium]